MKITIDGPAGSGKSTVARMLSEKLGFLYLETGLGYRVCAYLWMKNFPNDEPSWEKLKPLLEKIKIEPLVGRTDVWVEHEKVNDLLTTEEVGRVASQVATLKELREYLNSLFRRLLEGKDAVVEGRDAGTVIFPEAELKIFVTADPKERARRRVEQLRAMGKDISYEEVLKAILDRDERDKNRAVAPLRPPEGAIIIDNTSKTSQQIVEEILSLLKERERS